MSYRISAQVTNIFERKINKHVTGVGQNATFVTESAGWYIELDHAISVFVGHEPPEFQLNQSVSVVITGKANANT